MDIMTSEITVYYFISRARAALSALQHYESEGSPPGYREYWNTNMKMENVSYHNMLFHLNVHESPRIFVNVMSEKQSL